MEELLRGISRSVFKKHIPALAGELTSIVGTERRNNSVFAGAFEDLISFALHDINPNLTEHAMQDMLIQYLFTRRFAKAFFTPVVYHQNALASMLEAVVEHCRHRLICQSFCNLLTSFMLR